MHINRLIQCVLSGADINRVLTEAIGDEVTADLRKVFPKTLFPKWDIVVYKPKRVWFKKNEVAVVIDNDTGNPSFMVTYPKTLNRDFVNFGEGWAEHPHANGHLMQLKGTFYDQTEWREDLPKLKRAITHIVKSNV